MSGIEMIYVFLNQPLIKEGIKTVAGTAAFFIGVIEIINLCLILQGRITVSFQGDSRWNKIGYLCAKISLILGAFVSRPGLMVISTAIGWFFSSSQLETVFGPNTIFALNPWHPRHIASLVAVAFAIPPIMQCFYGWRIPEQEGKMRMITLFATVISRPVLHLGNQLAHVC